MGFVHKHLGLLISLHGSEAEWGEDGVRVEKCL